MTYVGKFFKFVCNKCDRVIYVDRLPKNWTWIPTPPMGVIHHCDECEKKRIAEYGT